MAQGDGAAVHVDLFFGQAELADAAERLGRKGFVQLDEVEVGDGETGAGQGLLGGGDRAVAHGGGVDAGGGHGANAGHGLHAELAGGFGGGDHDGGGTVVERGAVARGDRAPAAEGGPQLGELFE
jgi:hypothetical protein